MLPDYIGPSACGLKMGVIVPGCDLTELILNTVKNCDRDGLLEDGDIICITESIVARAQNNFVTTESIAAEVRSKMGLKPDSRLGIIWPITSRNRFSLILRAFAQAVPEGEIIVQLPYPADEVGNQIIPPEFIKTLGKKDQDIIYREEFVDQGFVHPITGMDYPTFYENIVSEVGAKTTIYLSNDPRVIADFKPDGVIVANVHDRKQTHAAIVKAVPNCLTLQDFCNKRNSGQGWSEWGLLGSNLSADNRLKLAPREGDLFSAEVQKKIKDATGKCVEALIYGDGAYKDPSTGIYELADPQPVFGATAGFRKQKMRSGVKYKYLADLYLADGKDLPEIEALLSKHKNSYNGEENETSGGTTPRRLEDLVASLADLVSGSADAGTPVILVKRFLKGA